MSDHRFSLAQAAELIQPSIATVPSSVALPAAAAASGLGAVEAYRRVSFDQLPAELKEQLRTDGLRDGDRRSDMAARDHFEQNVHAEARGSVEGVDAVVNNPSIHAMHIVSHANGGSGNASNIVYGPASLNSSIQERTMTASEVAEAESYTLDIAEQATPGVTGDLGEVVGDTFETGGLGGVMGGGFAAVHRLAQAQGYRDAGRHDLADQAEDKIFEDAAKGAVNGMVRGTTVAVTQAVLGANPLTAGIGLVVPDAVSLLTQKDSLSEDEYNRRAAGVVGKGALATVLVCAGPIGWIGLAGLSIATAYGNAASQQGPNGLQKA